MFKSITINKAIQSLGVVLVLLTLTALLAACGDTATPVATTTTAAASAGGAAVWTQVQLSDALQTLVKKRFPGVANLTGSVAVSNDDVATVITFAKTAITGYTCTSLADGSSTGGPSVLGCTSANLDIIYQISPTTDAALSSAVEGLPADDIAKLKTAATGKKTLVQMVTGTDVVKAAIAIIAAGGVAPVPTITKKP